MRTHDGAPEPQGEENPPVARWTRALTIVSVLAAALSAGSALYATSQAHRANELVARQNAILEEGAQPDISLRHLFTYRRYLDDYKSPCLTTDGDAAWERETGVAIDVTNLGGRSISLTDVRPRREGKVQTFSPLASARVSYGFFLTEVAFRTWLARHEGPRDVGAEGFVFGPLPKEVDSGRTVRLVLHGYEFVLIDHRLLPPSKFKKTMLSVGQWVSDLEFRFADGHRGYLTIPVGRPYLFEPGSVREEPLKDCPP